MKKLTFSQIRIKLIAPILFGLSNLFKYTVAIFKKRKMASCLLQMSIDWQELRCAVDRKIMLENAKTGRLLTIICVIFMYGGGIPYITVLPLSKGAVVRGNVSFRQLAYPSYFVFFNPQVRQSFNYVYTIILCIQ